MIHRHQWLAQNTEAVVWIVHGVFEHGGRYDELAAFLNSRSISVLSQDLPGHGLSSGTMGYIESWERLLDVLEKELDDVIKRYPNVPVFAMGQSLGGLLLVSLLSRRQYALRGVVLMSPALKVKEDLSPLLQKMAPILARMAPRLKTIPLDATAISRDPEEIKKYQEDPLIYHGKVYANTGNETLAATKKIGRFFPEFHWPVLMLHGTADRLTEPKGSQHFYEEIKSSDKQIHLLDGWYHELIHEKDKQQIFELISKWIESRK